MNESQNNNPAVTLNQELVLRVESIAYGGKGVARYNDFVVFIPFVIPGELVKVQIIDIKSNYAESALLEVIEASEDRISPKCKYFTICGGCSYQHIVYEKQVFYKTEQVKDLYRKFLDADNDFIEPMCASLKDYNYRTKIRMKYKNNNGVSTFGYFDYFDNKLVDIEKCDIASENINNHLNAVRQDDFKYFKNKRIKAFNLMMVDTPSGIMDSLSNEKETLVEVLGKRFYYNRDSFFQINHSIFPSLFEYIFKILKEKGKSGSLLDLYCGVGFFGIILSDIFEKLIFIEENRTSFNYLLKNLSENKIEKRSEYYRASVDKALKSIKISPDVVLMDPPRSGANEMSISQIVSFNPELVIYISCNPSTQIRDFKYFNNKGYKVVNLRPFDFFPQTKHIESVALLQKK